MELTLHVSTAAQQTTLLCTAQLHTAAYQQEDNCTGQRHIMQCQHLCMYADGTYEAAVCFSCFSFTAITFGTMHHRSS